MLINSRSGGPGQSRAILLVLTLVTTATLSSGRTHAIRPTPLDKEAAYRRFLWVTRWDFKSPEDIQKICRNAASARFTDLFFQVRGDGTVYFKSAYEPWAAELSGRGVEGLGADPGWDPLAVAIREARRNGLRLHAWINAMPAWHNSRKPPAQSKQLIVRNASWLLADEAGRPVHTTGFYSFLEPGLPEVRSYLAALVSDMVKNYPVDGVHLDYIRYPLPEEAGCDCSHHPRVLKDFEKASGKTREQAPEEWNLYRQRQVTATIRAIRHGIQKVRPEVELSCTCMADFRKRFGGACQDAEGWLDEGIVDAVVPMVYVRGDLRQFASMTAPFSTPARRGRLWVGIWPRDPNPNYLDQISMSAAALSGGVAIFSYGELFPRHRVTRSVVNIYKTFVGEPITQPTPTTVLAAAPPKKPSPKPAIKLASTGKTAKPAGRPAPKPAIKLASTSKAAKPTGKPAPRPASKPAPKPSPSRSLAVKKKTPGSSSIAKIAGSGTKSKSSKTLAQAAPASKSRKPASPNAGKRTSEPDAAQAKKSIQQ